MASGFRGSWGGLAGTFTVEDKVEPSRFWYAKVDDYDIFETHAGAKDLPKTAG